MVNFWFIQNKSFRFFFTPMIEIVAITAARLILSGRYTYGLETFLGIQYVLVPPISQCNLWKTFHIDGSIDELLKNMFLSVTKG